MHLSVNNDIRRHSDHMIDTIGDRNAKTGKSSFERVAVTQGEWHCTSRPPSSYPLHFLSNWEMCMNPTDEWKTL